MAIQEIYKIDTFLIKRNLFCFKGFCKISLQENAKEKKKSEVL